MAKEDSTTTLPDFNTPEIIGQRKDFTEEEVYRLNMYGGDIPQETHETETTYPPPPPRYVDKLVEERTLILTKTIERLQSEIAGHEKARDELTRALKEKDVLLREINHRVKNNMQIVSSLLKLQSSQIDDGFYSNLFKESQNRILSMAHLYDQLCRSSEFTHVDYKDYVTKLVKDLHSSYKSPNCIIRVYLDLERIYLKMDIAAPLGLVLNELISNAFKHAFPDYKSGSIYVTLKSVGEAVCLITVKDDGVGLPKGFDLTQTKPIGLNLVVSLVETQLGGKMEFISDGGTEVRVQFMATEPLKGEKTIIG